MQGEGDTRGKFHFLISLVLGTRYNLLCASAWNIFGYSAVCSNACHFAIGLLAVGLFSASERRGGGASRWQVEYMIEVTIAVWLIPERKQFSAWFGGFLGSGTWGFFLE